MLGMRKTHSKVGILILSLLFLIGCSEIPSEYKSFFRLSPENQNKEIFNYPLEKQIDIMIVGMTVPKPRRRYLVIQVAKNGEKIIPALFRRLPTAQSPYELDVLLSCLLYIDHRHFEWLKDPTYRELFKQELPKITDPALREEAAIILVPYESSDQEPT